MKLTILLTSIFTASIMMNIFTLAPECFQLKPTMTAENLPHNQEFAQLVARLNQLPVRK